MVSIVFNLTKRNLVKTKSYRNESPKAKYLFEPFLLLLKIKTNSGAFERFFRKSFIQVSDFLSSLIQFPESVRQLNRRKTRIQ